MGTKCRAPGFILHAIRDRPEGLLMNAPAPIAFDPTDRARRGTPTRVLSGPAALVELMISQAAADRAAGLNTGGLVSGYRGSPLGGVDQEMWRTADRLSEAGIRFLPAINEELGASALHGSQQAESDPLRKVDGVFALWYGKGPGLDRAGDALHHGHAYGASAHGGVLVAAGDDHGAVSSSMSHQSDVAMMAWRMPVIHPASVGEYLQFGAWGIAASRFSGAWIGFKAISETVESSAVVGPAAHPTFATPSDFEPPAGGLHYRPPGPPSPETEERIVARLEAVKAFARANPLDRPVATPSSPRLVIVTVGKAHLDAMEALRVGGLRPQDLAARGIGLYKIGLVYPIEAKNLLAALAGAEEVMVIEEKAGIVELQLKELLYNMRGADRPRLVGKTDETGAELLPLVRELRPSIVARALAARLDHFGVHLALPKRWLRRTDDLPAAPHQRRPYFCSGCPHNTSTRVPEGSTARAGIGCHFMANWMDRETSGMVPMGSEGVDWVGLAPFTDRPHVFQNLGDGTYFHSGHLAIRQAVAARTNITFKILFNDAVAMTGGQPVDGPLTVPRLTRLVAAEGVASVDVVTDDPSKHALAEDLAPGTRVHHRDDLDVVQRRLRETPGVTVLIYDQTCATEARRRRKRGLMSVPTKRAFINHRVCEGCGDCQAQSNCLSIVPVETPLGVKREIDQSSCNVDLSCVKGFCPAFVTVEGGSLKTVDAANTALLDRAATLPTPPIPRPAEPYEILLSGVGGTGIVTVGRLLIEAARVAGLAASKLDFTGFAQKGGPVLAHVRVCADGTLLHQVRIDRGRADALLAADLVVATAPDTLAAIDTGRTRVLVSTHEIPTGSMLRDPLARIDTAALLGRVRTMAGSGRCMALDAQDLARLHAGHAGQANVLMLGHAWQSGMIPLPLAAMEAAIASLGRAADAGRLAFACGRLAAAGALGGDETPAPTLDDIVAHRTALLTDYQDAAYAARYRRTVEAVRSVEARLPGAPTRITEAVARNLAKLMAYKDEYEVARLHTDGVLASDLAGTFDGEVRLSFHMAPPLLARRRAGEDAPRKMTFGPWIVPVLKMLAHGRRLRGTPLDPFGWTAERRAERRLVEEYLATLEDVLPALGPDNADLVRRLAELPDTIRGYGHVKAASMKRAAAARTALLTELRAGNARAEPRAETVR
jgi:indolepyruvate ferredoxin oxidoreductase